MRTRPIALSLAAAAFLLIGCGSPAPPAPELSGCQSCHAGIEHIHTPLPRNACSVCHGGVESAQEQEKAHVAVPEDWAEIRGTALDPAPPGYIKDFSADQLDRLSPEYLRFINPADLRVADQSCGTCHQQITETVKTSVMATNAGHYFPTLFLAGAQEDRTALYGSMDVTVDTCEPPITSCSLTPLRAPDFNELQGIIESGDDSELEVAAYKNYLSSNCNHCHQSAYSENNAPGLYRSTGCAACHLPYGEDGLYLGADQTVDRDYPVHPKSHELTSAIPSEQCASCHFQGGRIGLLFRGIREGGFNDLPPYAETIDRPLYGRPPGFYVSDEDTRNDIDETPPDIHFSRGMHCADCHFGSDVHGDGQLHASAKSQLDIACEDCHGTSRQELQPDKNGQFRTAGGRLLKNLRMDNEGRIILKGQVDGKDHPVRQPAAMLDQLAADSPMKVAMGEDPHGWSHTDSLTCDTCHTSYNQQCVGCHITYDLRFEGLDRQTGLSTPGLALSERGWTSLEQVLLGQRADGKIQSVIASQQVQLSVVGSAALGGEGKLLIGEAPQADQAWHRGRFRQRSESSTPGFAPFFQHTTSRKARPCATCHRRDNSKEELSRVRGVYGYGTGEYMLPGEGSTELDPFQFLDNQDKQISPWQQAGTGAVAQPRREKALSVILNKD
ncbi:MAG: hypothetical protein MK135_03935 [Polyangiaceae bacterium]|nr:hypothetical protein [Polyangiaceae bacterium]